MAIAAATHTIRARSLSAKNSFDLVVALLVMLAIFLMKPPLIVSLPALTSFAATAPTQTVAMPTLLSTPLHLLVERSEPLVTARKEPNALNAMCLNVRIMLTQVHAVTKSAGFRTSTLRATCVRPSQQKQRRTRQRRQIFPATRRATTELTTTM
jgi:hypothetical protein